MQGKTIGWISRRTGVPIATMRFYERQGLIESPPRSQGGFRLYDSAAIRRLRFIRQAKDLGFSLTEIRELLSIQHSPQGSCGEVRQHALKKMEEVERRIRRLTSIKQALSGLSQACPGAGPIGGCPILGALQSEET